MDITQIQFTNSKGQSVTIDKSGQYRLTDKLQTSGLGSTSYTTKAYGQNGRTWHDSVYDIADMELNFMIMKRGRTLSQELADRQLVNKVFAPHLGEGILRVTLSTGDQFYRDCTVDAAPLYPTRLENNNNTWQDVIVELVANDPLWRNAEQTNSIGSPASFNVVNNGNAPTGFEMDFVIPSATGFTLTNTTTGEKLQVTNQPSTNRRYHINTKDGHQILSISTDGGSNYFTEWENVSGTFFKLEAGTNTITLGSSATGVSITYADRFTII